MTKRITVLPALGRAVPDPEAGDLLPLAGREVPDNAWWRRRLADGDVTLNVAKPNKAASAAKPEETK